MTSMHITICPQILHVYGPLSLHVYGLCIAAALLVSLLLVARDLSARKLLSQENFLDGSAYTILAGVVGGRALFAFEYWHELPSLTYIFQIWNPGYSILGTLICAAAMVYWYLNRYATSPLEILDRVTLYAPLGQAIGRVGCFFTGCCYGIDATSGLAVVYENEQCLAPLYKALHATQLYSCFLLFTLFCILFFVQKRVKHTGQLLALFFIGTSIERFSVDFLRANRTLIGGILSVSQIVALGVFCVGCIIFYVASNAKRTKSQSL